MSQGLLLRFIRTKRVSLSLDQIRAVYWLGFDSGRVHNASGNDDGMAFQDYEQWFLEDARRAKFTDKDLSKKMLSIGWKDNPS